MMFTERNLTQNDLLRLRKDHIFDALTLSYSSINNPLNITHGNGQYMYDSNGTKYLDCRNNVPHIGHGNIDVANAVYKQLLLLNSNTRYLNELMLKYAHNVQSLFPSPLNYITFVNSGSEANELALRVAKAYHNFDKNKCDIVVCEHAYHGNTQTLIDLSTYKIYDQTNKPLPYKIPNTTHILPIPDSYRGAHWSSSSKEKEGDTSTSLKLNLTESEICDFYVNKFEQLIIKSNYKIGIFLIESVISCGGQIFLPKNFLFKCKKLCEKYDIIMICDEVQVGFGRLGYPYIWAFEYNNDKSFVPDIVTLGKPMGNGMSLAGVVTNKKIMQRFSLNNNGMQYFNTFGGNPVSCAAGQVVYDTIVKNDFEALKHVSNVGDYFLNKLKQLQTEINNYSVAIDDHDDAYDDLCFIGDVRGKGFFLGIEFVCNLKTRKVLDELKTGMIVNRLTLQPYNLLLSTDGPFENIIKMKPPICFNKENVDFLVRSMKSVIIELIDNKFDCDWYKQEIDRLILQARSLKPNKDNLDINISSKL